MEQLAWVIGVLYDFWILLALLLIAHRLDQLRLLISWAVGRDRLRRSVRRMARGRRN